MKSAIQIQFLSFWIKKNWITINFQYPLDYDDFIRPQMGHVKNSGAGQKSTSWGHLLVSVVL